MHELTVTAEQAQLILQAGGPLVIVDERGKPLGHFTPDRSGTPIQLSDRAHAEIKRRMESTAPGLTTSEVINYLNSLENA
jgi:hypothetical protein